MVKNTEHPLIRKRDSSTANVSVNGIGLLFHNINKVDLSFYLFSDDIIRGPSNRREKLLLQWVALGMLSSLCWPISVMRRAYDINFVK